MWKQLKTYRGPAPLAVVSLIVIMALSCSDGTMTFEGLSESTVTVEPAGEAVAQAPYCTTASAQIQVGNTTTVSASGGSGFYSFSITGGAALADTTSNPNTISSASNTGQMTITVTDTATSLSGTCSCEFISITANTVNLLGPTEVESDFIRVKVTGMVPVNSVTVEIDGTSIGTTLVQTIPPSTYWKARLPSTASWPLHQSKSLTARAQDASLGTIGQVTRSFKRNLNRDFNGDSYPDLIIGSPDANTGAGKVSLHFGGDFGGLPPTPPVSFTKGGDSTGEHYGAAVALVGDINGDGFSDLVAGAPSANVNKGTTRVYFGNLVGSITTPDQVYHGSDTGDRLGQAVAAAGDIDRDGKADFLIGVPGASVGAIIKVAGAGMVNIVLGKDLATPLTLTSEGFSAFGKALSYGGDVNGDGFGDVLIGANSAIGAGAVIWYRSKGSTSGSTSQDYVDELVRLIRGTSVDEFASKISGGQDANGDGLSDIMVAMPGFGLRTGKAFFFASVMNNGTYSLTASEFIGTQLGGDYGAAVALLPDTNGDGRAEVAIGAPKTTESISGSAQPFAGRVEYWIGRASGGYSGAAPTTLTRDLADDSLFGTSVSAVDLNLDGYNDLTVGAPGGDTDVASNTQQRGRVLVYQGSTSALASPLFQLREITPTDGDRFGAALR